MLTLVNMMSSIFIMNSKKTLDKQGFNDLASVSKFIGQITASLNVKEKHEAQDLCEMAP